MNAEKPTVGKVLTATRKTYNVSIKDRIVSCTLRGKLALKKNEKNTVKVGDDVRIEFVTETEGVIAEILPRRSFLSRSIQSRQYKEQIIATNIDQLLVILSTKKPQFKSGLLDRYLVIAEKNKLRPVICINKIDLASRADFEIYRRYYSETLDFPVVFTSAITGEGIQELQKVLQNAVTALVGYSGVGKSSIIKAINPELDIRVGAVSERTQKGQHTTTVVQLFPLADNCYVIDTPGIRELGFWGIYKKDLATYFRDIQRYTADCKFSDCQHLHEPGCAVIEAVTDGDIIEERYRNYVSIYQSLKSTHYE